MKKVYLFILTILFIFPISVLAATATDEKPNVITVDAKANENIIEYNGTTEDGCYAVMCKLYNASGEEIDLLSSAVENNAFTGSFTTAKAGKYTVGCARYEGGDIKQADVTVLVDGKNPKTFDAGIIGSVVAIALFAAGIIIVIIAKKKK